MANVNQELDKRVYVSEIKEMFNLKQVSGDKESLKRWTIAPDINRPGLELAGYEDDTELKRIVIIGNKEQGYISGLDYETQRNRFGFLTDSYTPCIIITAGRKAPQALIDVANEKNFPVFEYSDKTYMLVTSLTSYLSEKLAHVEWEHGEMLNIYGTGVMVTGSSGIGKSELALDLIKRGHVLVADDIVEYSRIHNEIFCESPANLKKMLEVRGLGVLDVTLMFGAQCFLEKCKLDFVIKLVTKEEYKTNNNDRLSPTEKSVTFFNLEKTLLEIPVTEGKNMSTIIEASVINYILKNRGVDSNEQFKEKIRLSILDQTAEKGAL